MLICHILGDDLNINKEEAARYLKTAADSGYWDSIIFYASMLEKKSFDFLVFKKVDEIVFIINL